MSVAVGVGVKPNVVPALELLLGTRDGRGTGGVAADAGSGPTIWAIDK